MNIFENTIQTKTLSKHDFDILRGISYRADETISIIQELDRRGRKLEATLLCMYEGFSGTCLAEYDPRIGPLTEWAHSSGGLGLSDWLNDSSNLDRMKHIRNMHYVEYRACKGYIEGVKRYGYSFAKLHYQPLTNLPTSNIGNPRWYNAPNAIWFGLPDHEFAEMHFARALVIDHLWRHFDRFLKDGMLNAEQQLFDEDLKTEAFCWAYYAWSLDKDNPDFREFLITALTDPFPTDVDWTRSELLRQRRQLDRLNHREVFGGHPRLMEDWAVHSNIMEYFSRAQKIAKLADVSYDSRRGDDLPKGYTEETREA